MGELIKTGSNELVHILHGQGGRLTVPKPFERDIFLFDTHIAGTTHITGIDELEPHLNVDDKLDFFREPDNQYDKKAIIVRNASGLKIGYVPKADNAVFARLMDAGKYLFGRIASKERQGSWLKVEIKIYLRE